MVNFVVAELFFFVVVFLACIDITSQPLAQLLSLIFCKIALNRSYFGLRSLARGGLWRGDGGLTTICCEQLMICHKNTAKESANLGLGRANSSSSGGGGE